SAAGLTAGWVALSAGLAGAWELMFTAGLLVAASWDFCEASTSLLEELLSPLGFTLSGASVALIGRLVSTTVELLGFSVLVCGSWVSVEASVGRPGCGETPASRGLLSGRRLEGLDAAVGALLLLAARFGLWIASLCAMEPA